MTRTEPFFAPGLLALALIVVALPSCDWFDKRMQVAFGDTYVDPATDDLVATFDNFQPELDINESWSSSLGEIDNDFFKSVPTVLDDVIYLSDIDKVIALDAKKGNRLWSGKAPSQLSFGVTADEEQVIVGTKSGELISFAANDGKKLWRTRLSDYHITSISAIHKGNIGVRVADGTVVLLSSDDGEEQWRVFTDLPIVTLSGMSAPVFFSNIMMVGLDDGRVLALDTSDGYLLYEFNVAQEAMLANINEFSDIDGPLAIRHGIIYASSAQGRTAAFDIGRQALVWVSRSGSRHGVMLGDENLYLIDRDGQVAALDLVSGARVWRTEKFSQRQLTSPAFIYPFVVVGDNLGYLYWLTKDNGSFLARRRVTRHPLSTLLALPDETHVLSLGEHGNIALLYTQKLDAS